MTALSGHSGRWREEGWRKRGWVLLGLGLGWEEEMSKDVMVDGTKNRGKAAGLMPIVSWFIPSG